MNIDILIEQIVDQIQNKIDEGLDILESNIVLRIEIDDVLKRQSSQSNADKSMVKLTKHLIKMWPNPRGWAFQTIEARLNPLREIAELLNSKEVENFIHVRDNLCAMEESRMPLKEFKKLLWEGLFRETELE